MRWLATLFLIVTTCTLAVAQETHHDSAPTGAATPGDHRTSEHATVDAEPHPELPASSTWVPVLLMVIGGMFVAAAAIGPIIHANAPEEVPPMHAHDEPPGSSHHHGASGIINPSPEHTQGHGHH